MIGILIFYVIFNIAFYFFQHFVFFRPEILPSNFEYKYEFPHEELSFDMEDGGKINGIHFKVPNSKGVIYYFKGNSRSIKGWGKFSKEFLALGYDFFMVDYRGFGKSKGKRSEAIIYSDMQHIYKWLTSHYEEKDIVIYGRSLGSGFAARIASWNRPKMLILDSPYYSLRYQLRRFAYWMPIKYILRYRIPTFQFVKSLTVPLYVIHGTWDLLITINNSEKLVSSRPENSKLIKIEKGRHNNLPSFKQYYEALYDILS
ncbi:MAG: alpha/beta hydrolase [Bacteroidota bacterium]